MIQRPDPTLPLVGFPNPDALCEHCGYSLQGTAADQVCPECGLPAADSHPDHRPGLPWQRQRTPQAWLGTALQVGLKPRRSFRAMRIAGDISGARLYLLVSAVGVALIWEAVRWCGGVRAPWWVATVVAAAVIAMSYVEALGVAWVTHRRGWRYTWELAEQIVCYSAIGWLPAALAMVKLVILDQQGTFDHWWYGTAAFSPDIMKFIAAAGAVGVSSLGFETLVWIGVEHTKFANRPLDAAG